MLNIEHVEGAKACSGLERTLIHCLNSVYNLAQVGTHVGCTTLWGVYQCVIESFTERFDLQLSDKATGQVLHH